MNNAKIKFFYAAYVFVITLLFLFFLFPEETVKEYVLAKLREKAPEIELRIGSIGLAFPFGLKLAEVRITYQEKTLDAVQVKIKPGLASLWGEDIVLYFECKAYEGEIDGKMLLPKKGVRRISADMQAADLALDEMPVLKDATPHRIRGYLGGEVTFTAGFTGGQTGVFQLHLKEFGIDFSEPFYGLEKLTLNQLTADLNLKNNRLTVEGIQVQGGDVAGSLSGSVIIRQPFEKSIVSIQGDMAPQPVFLNTLRKTLPVDAFIKKGAGGKNIPFRVEGTPEKPRFSLR